MSGGESRWGERPEDRSRMLELLGTACVGWTLFELSGLLHSARDRSADAHTRAHTRAHTGAHTGAHAHSPGRADASARAASAPRSSPRRDVPRGAAPRRPERARRFDAWDDQGNRIVVEDLGLR